MDDPYQDHQPYEFPAEKIELKDHIYVLSEIQRILSSCDPDLLNTFFDIVINSDYVDNSFKRMNLIDEIIYTSSLYPKSISFFTTICQKLSKNFVFSKRFKKELLCEIIKYQSATLLFSLFNERVYTLEKIHKYAQRSNSASLLLGFSEIFGDPYLHDIPLELKEINNLVKTGQTEIITELVRYGCRAGTVEYALKFDDVKLLKNILAKTQLSYENEYRRKKEITQKTIKERKNKLKEYQAFQQISHLNYQEKIEYFQNFHKEILHKEVQFLLATKPPGMRIKISKAEERSQRNWDAIVTRVNNALKIFQKNKSQLISNSTQKQTPLSNRLQKEIFNVKKSAVRTLDINYSFFESSNFPYKTRDPKCIAAFFGSNKCLNFLFSQDQGIPVDFPIFYSASASIDDFFSIVPEGMVTQSVYESAIKYHNYGLFIAITQKKRFRPIGVKKCHLYHNLFSGEFELRNFPNFMKDYEIIENALHNKQIDLVIHLIESGVEFYESFLISETMEMGADDLFKYFIDNNIDLLTPDMDELMPLHKAVDLEKLSYIEIILNHGVDINQKNPAGITALTYACDRYKPNFDVIKYLIEHGANVQVPDGKLNTALHYAVKHTNIKLVQYLIECGANVNAENSSYKTPLAIAKEANPPCDDMIRLLLDNRAVDVGPLRLKLEAVFNQQPQESDDEKTIILSK